MSSIYEPPYIPYPEPTYFEHRPSPHTFNFILSYLLYFHLCAALGIEMLVRNFVIDVFFPNFKLPWRISIPEKLDKVLTVVFYVLFLLGNIQGIYILIIIIPYYIIHSLN